MGKPLESNVWVERDVLIQMGFLKLVQREDEKQAAAAGLQTKQLTQPGVEKHLTNFGVDPESASHTQISQLSGGMKVKVVLAAAMWQNPHILILDEPTNHLDRDGLGASVLAIKDYKGGVLIISHNKDVYDGAGNKIDVKANAAVSAKDAKKQIKDLEKKLKDGLKKKTLTDEEKWEIEDKIVALKEKLESA